MTEDPNIIFELENYIKSIWQFTPVPLAYLNKLGVFMEINPSFINLIGSDKNDIIGKSIKDILGKNFDKVQRNVLKKKAVKGEILKVRNSKGADVFVNASASIRTDDSGKVIGYFISLLDITARIMAENAVRESEALFKAIFNKSANLIAITDLKGNIIICNDTRKEKLGCVEEKKKDLFSNLKKDDRERMKKALNEVISGKNAVQIEYDYILKNSVKTIDSMLQMVVLNGEPRILVISNDVTDKRREEELRIKQLEKEDFNKIRNQFMMRVSHELRHPLVPIIGYASVMLEENPSEIQRKYLQKIIENTEQLKNLINNILQVTSLESGEQLVRMVPLNVNTILRTVVSNYKTKADIKDLKVKTSFNLNKNVSVDKVLFKRLVENLIDNAIKYTDKGFVKVSTKGDKGNALIIIEDSGAGIPKEELSVLIRERYERELGSRQEGLYRGLGLGLILSNLIVAAHKGKLLIDSKPGKGTKFTIIIPFNSS